MLYVPPTGAATANDPYIGKNVAAGIQGSKVPPHAVEYPQREIVNAELIAGLTPSNTDTTQLAQAISIGIFLGVFGGTANALTATLPGSLTIPALTVGMTFHGIVGLNSNTSAATLTLSGFTAVPGTQPIVKRNGTSALIGGDLQVDALVSFRWDGTSFRHIGTTASDAVAAVSAAKTLLLLGGSGTFTVPAGITRLRFREVGGGGGAGGCNYTQGGSPGGGGGSYAEGEITVTPGEVIPYSVGQGGAGGAPGINGTGGGPTSFGVYATAVGGAGSSAASAGSPFPTTAGSTGTSTGGQINWPSIAGGGGSGSNGYVGGVGGGTYGQGATNIAPSGSGQGLGGALPGFGGNGAGGGSYAGGAGYPGYILLEY